MHHSFLDALFSLSVVRCRTTRQWTCLGWTTCWRMAGAAATARDTCTLTIARRSSCPRFESELMTLSLFSHVRLMFLSYVPSQAYYTDFNPYQNLSSPKVSHHLVPCGRIKEKCLWCRAGQFINFKIEIRFFILDNIYKKKIGKWIYLLNSAALCAARLP